MYVFLEVGNPDTYKVFPNPKCSKIAGTYMRFCGEQRAMPHCYMYVPSVLLDLGLENTFEAQGTLSTSYS